MPYNQTHLFSGSFWRHLLIIRLNSLLYFLNSSFESAAVSKPGGSFCRVSIKTCKIRSKVKIWIGEWLDRRDKVCDKSEFRAKILRGKRSLLHLWHNMVRSIQAKVGIFQNWALNFSICLVQTPYSYYIQLQSYAYLCCLFSYLWHDQGKWVTIVGNIQFWVFNIIYLHISNPTFWSIPPLQSDIWFKRYMSNSLNFKTM